MTTLGGPGGQQKIYRPSPPERGSFPLDHEAECKHFMMPYLRCLKLNRGQNSEDCRGLAKQYLACRMDNNLMAPDEFRNLGFKDDDNNVNININSAASATKLNNAAAASSIQSDRTDRARTDPS